VHLIQIYFEYKYSKKVLIFGFESIGFDIPVYTSLATNRLCETVTSMITSRENHEYNRY